MLNIGKVYKTNSCGNLIIIENTGRLSCLVEFVDTKSRVTAMYGNIRAGSVYDYMRPSICGVGFIGLGIHKAYVDGRRCRSYSVWSNMMRRCYDIKVQAKQPTYKGCSVCDEWHNYQNYAEWFDKNQIEGFEVDKDIKINGNKIYSPSACSFVSKKDNVSQSHSKKYKIKSPEGVVVDVYNLNDFCKVNKLDASNMLKVLSGKYSNQKGWTRP
tara:strand:- start:21 stop:659 length:639 start_codon:yes stop_codon:yes gene_type:complete